MKQNVGFIIVAYKPNPESIENLQNSLKGKPIVLVDNTGHNKGFGSGVNVGIQKAIAQCAKWVVVLNQDIQMTKEAVKELCERLRELPLGIAGPFSGKLDSKRWTTILPSDKVDYISGACMAIHRKVIEKVGLFYEPYFMYYEDADYCVRAKKAGFPLIHVLVKGITHNDNPTLGKGSFLHEYYLARNHLFFVKRLAPLRVKSHEYIRLPKTLAGHALYKNTGALEGIKDYFLGRFGEKKL